MGKGQGHEHGECDVAARRVWEYDPDEIQAGAASVWRVPAPLVVVVLGRDTRTP